MKSNYSNLGSRLRHLIELLDGDVAISYAEAGLSRYKPRYTPVFRALMTNQAMTIKQLTMLTKVSQPAITQTINEMEKHNLITRMVGDDARERKIILSKEGLAMVPALEMQWQLTQVAAASLDEELEYALLSTVDSAITALKKVSFKQRMTSTNSVDSHD